MNAECHYSRAGWKEVARYGIANWEIIVFKFMAGRVQFAAFCKNNDTGAMHPYSLKQACLILNHLEKAKEYWENPFQVLRPSAEDLELLEKYATTVEI